MNVQPPLEVTSITQPTPQRWLYLGPLRSESLNALLVRAEAPKEAHFVTPDASEDAWHHVIEVLPDAHQRTATFAEHAGEQPYYRYSLPEFNSTRLATGLLSLYPGLVMEDDTPARLEPLKSLVNEITEQPVGTLVVEQPELVQPLLEGLEKTKALACLQHLWLRTGQESLYEDTPREAELLDWCEQRGFELSQRLTDDPDFPLLQLRRNPLFDALELEQARNHGLAQERDAFGEEIALFKKRRNELKQQVEKRQEALEQANLENDRLSRQLDEHKSAARDSEKTRAQLASENSKLQAELKASHERLESQQKTAKESQQQVEKLKNRLKSETEALNQSLDEEKKHSQQLEEQLAKKEKLDEKDPLQEKEQLQENEQAMAQSQDKLDKQEAENKKLEKRVADRQQQVNDLQKRNQILQGENERFSQRQSQLENELLKAEAQIDVIKDLMLNE